jgi:ABC-type antimicrobial peptide transport system permease subunit
MAFRCGSAGAIGIYRAIGMTRSRVAGLFLAEAALFGLLGGIVGSVGGILLAQVSHIGQLTISASILRSVRERRPGSTQLNYGRRLLKGF